MAGGFRSLGVSLLFLVEGILSQTFPYANIISRTGWTASASSQQIGSEASRVLDGNGTTLWHSVYSPTVASLPHTLTIDMKQTNVINGVSYHPRTDGNNNGNVYKHRIAISNDGTTFTNVANGYYIKDETVKYSFFSTTTARYVRLIVESEFNGNQFASAAEFNVYTPVPAVPLGSFTPPPSSQGRWGQTIELPITPAAASITADNKVVFWSSYRPDNYGSAGNTTWTSTWNPINNDITIFEVTKLAHNMFCPGISLDAEGVVVVTGGNGAEKTSKYRPATGDWVAAPLMQRPRGYQSQTTIGDGRIFVIGGSWSGGRGNKHGEVYDPVTNAWTKRDGCVVDRIVTGDRAGIYRADNHAWLFAWKSNSIFNAGPSKAMTWFNITGNGAWANGGNRGADADAMCATAAMYDAGAGLILSAGGSPHYDSSDATKSTHIIKLNNVGAVATVTKIANMTYARAFANSVILPDGKVFVVGGQAIPKPFQDTTAAMPAELWDPATNTWTVMAPINVPRVYHSVALLLPDATVIAGGGGLCGKGCKQNHPDVQVWTPPYLLNSNGSLKTRPTIVTVSATSLKPGATIIITTNEAATFSLVRYGATTHTVNTDQRRVKLTTTSVGNQHTAVLPSDAGVLLPGYWMLFAINSAGTPSVAKQIKILLK